MDAETLEDWNAWLRIRAELYGTMPAELERRQLLTLARIPADARREAVEMAANRGWKYMHDARRKPENVAEEAAQYAANPQHYENKEFN